MKTILRYVRLYFLIGAQYAKAKMSYRADFIISVVASVFWCVPSFFSIIVIFTNIPTLAGWSLEELVFIYGFYLVAMGPVGIAFNNVWSLPWHVQSGSFLKYYFRPLNIMFYFMSETVDVNVLWALAVGTGLMVWSSVKLGIVWTAGRIIGTMFLALSASLIVDAFIIAASSAAFWFTNAHSLLALVSRFREYARYPLSIYNVAFRVIFSVILPIGFVAFYPVQWILRRGQAGIAPFLTPVVGAACFALAYLLWSAGTRRWSGTGT